MGDAIEQFPIVSYLAGSPLQETLFADPSAQVVKADKVAD
jgi:hypothetical protein